MKVLIDNGHGIDTKGKCSPDGKLREWAWAREVAQMLLEELTHRCIDAQRIVTESEDIDLATRVKRVNAICQHYGKTNCLLVSVHINAAGDDGKWHTANGFSVFCSKNASTNSKRCAALFTNEAEKRNLLGNRSVPAGRFWTWSWTTADIYILKNTNCPAVLTENLFQDNKTDAAWLQTGEGKRTIVELHADAIEKYIKTQAK